MRDKDVRILWISGKSYQLGDEIAKHKHKFCQLQFFMSGSEQLPYDGQLIDLKKNHLFIVFEGTSHGYVFLQGSTVLDIKFVVESGLYEIIRPVLECRVFYIDAPMLLMIIQQLHTAATVGGRELGEVRPLLMDSLLKLLLLGLYQERIERQPFSYVEPLLAKTQDNSKIKSMIGYLTNHYAEEIKLEDLSKHFHFSESYITRIFRDAIQLTPNQVLQEIRLNQAMNLLKSTNYPVERVAQSVGWSFNYFSRVFKRQKGMTPTDYRNMRQTIVDGLTLSKDFDLSLEPTTEKLS